MSQPLKNAFSHSHQFWLQSVCVRKRLRFKWKFTPIDLTADVRYSEIRYQIFKIGRLLRFPFPRTSLSTILFPHPFRFSFSFSLPFSHFRFWVPSFFPRSILFTLWLVSVLRIWSSEAKIKERPAPVWHDWERGNNLLRWFSVIRGLCDSSLV